MPKSPSVELNIFETILARRSVRNYTSQKVEEKKLRTLLEAAVHAPTAMHEEPWAFGLIQDKQMLKDLSTRTIPIFIEQLKTTGHSFDYPNEPEFNVFFNAGTLIIIYAKKNNAFVTADCWLAAENLMLAACAIGLGTCVIGSALPALNLAEEKKRMVISDEYEAIVPIIIGYPNEQPKAKKRSKPIILGKF